MCKGMLIIREKCLHSERGVSISINREYFLAASAYAWEIY